MGYKVSFDEANQIFAKLNSEYEIWAPKRFPGKGRYSDTDIIRYDKVKTVEEIVFDEKSDFPAKEVLSPITEPLIIIFMRPCDIAAQQRQERIYLGNGGFNDMYYERMHEKVKIVMMQCDLDDDTCFCVSMGTNKTDNYSLAVVCQDGALKVEVKDEAFAPYFEGKTADDYTPSFPTENKTKVTMPEIPNKEVLTKLKNHPMWEEYNKRCISCGSCTVACSTCTCFTTTDIAYNENGSVGERRRTTASCQIEGFTDMAGGHSFRNTAGDRMRYKVLHKFHDYKERFKDYHMCVGCGRCISRCQEFISITATVDKMNKAIAEIVAEENK